MTGVCNIDVTLTRQKTIARSSLSPCWSQPVLWLLCRIALQLYPPPTNLRVFNERLGLYGDIVMSERGAQGWGTTWSALRIRPEWAIFLNFLFDLKKNAVSCLFLFFLQKYASVTKKEKKIPSSTQNYFSLSKILPGALLCVCQLGFTGRVNHRISRGGALPHAGSELSSSIWQHWSSPGLQFPVLMLSFST